MKRFILLSFSVFFVFATSTACDISLKIEKEKTTYKPGDELIVKVIVVLTHGNCPKSIKAVEFVPENLKIVQGTEWKQTEPGVWERKLKVSVLATTEKNAKLTAQRKCEKEGGKTVLTLKL